MPTFKYKIQTCNITKVNPTKLCNVYKWKKDLLYVQVAIDFLRENLHRVLLLTDTADVESQEAFDSAV